MSTRRALQEVLTLAVVQHGAVARWQCLEGGMSSSAIDRRVNAGWRRLHPGVYLATPDAADDRTELSAATLALGVAGLAAAGSAAALHGFLGAVPPPAPIVLTTARDLPRLDGVVVRTSCHRDPDATTVDGVAATGVTRSLVDWSPSLAYQRVEEVTADLFRRGLTTPARVIACVDQLGRPPGAVALREVVSMLTRTGTGDSVLEYRLLQILRAAGLEEPQLGVRVRDENGRPVARIDLAYPAIRLAIEVDGLRFHATPAEKAADDRRQNLLVVLGWTVLRFSARDIRHNPQRVIATIAAAIRRLSGVSV